MKKPLILLTFLAVAGCAMAQLATPELMSPAHGLTNASVRQQLQWGTVSSATGYIVEVDTSASFNSPLLYASTLYSTSGITNSQYRNYLHYNTTYYWRVRAYRSGDTSAWSLVRTFHTSVRPSLSSPSNDTSAMGSYYPRQNFQWNCFYGSTGYTLQVDTTPTFSSPILRTVEVSSSVSSTGSVSQYVYNMRYGTMYYWRVRAYHTQDTSDWSVVRQFHTGTGMRLYDPSNSDSTGTYYTRQNFQWYNSYGSTGYLLQLDTTPDFSSPHLRTTSIAISATNTNETLSQYLYNMHYGKMYYWRMRAYNTQDTSDWSEVRHFHTRADMRLYGPANTDSTGNHVTRQYFQWYNSYGSTGYIIQWDTLPDFSTAQVYTSIPTNYASNNDETLGQYIYNMHYGKMYYWRMRAYNNADTSEWSAVRHFHTRANMSLYGPSNTDSTGNYYTRQNFQWYNSYGSTGYIIQWDTLPDFSTAQVYTSIPTNSATNTSETFGQYLYNMHYGKMHYWRMRAYNTQDTSEWSAVRHFHTSRRPTLNDPANNSTGYNISTYKLYWNNHCGSSSYLVQVDTTPAFSSPLLRTLTKTNAQTNNDNYLNVQPTGLRPGTTYYWRVRAINTADTSEWSLTWRFTTQYDVTTGPTLSSPANDSVGVLHNSALLVWNAQTDMTGYRYWVSTNASFSDTVARGATTLTFTNITNLYPSTTYYWKVQGVYATGNTAWSSVWHFTTADVPLAAPVLTAPANHASVQQSSVQLSWGSVYGALTYQLQFSIDSTFQTAVSSYTTATTHYNLSGLPSNMHYYWRVRSANNNAASEWSSTWTFNTNTCPTTFATIDTTIGDEEGYWFFGTFLSTPGTYTHILPNAQGCDSVVTLHLAVNHSVHDTTVVHDTTYINVYVHDTTIVHDTTYINNYIHDTTIVNNYIYDTTIIDHYIHDTTIITLHDTTIVDNYIHDTTIITLHDTTIITLHDTTIVDNYIHDTTIITLYDTTIVTLHDTTFRDVNYYNLEVSSVQQIGIAVGSGRFADSTVVEIAAIPVCGNHFVQWSDGNTENPRHVLVTDDITLLATFDVDSVGVTNVDAPSTTITVEGNILIVQGAAGQRIRIFDELGRLLATHDNLPATHSFRLPATGVYLIQIGTAPAHRVIVR